MSLITLCQPNLEFYINFFHSNLRKIFLNKFYQKLDKFSIDKNINIQRNSKIIYVYNWFSICVIHFRMYVFNTRRNNYIFQCIFKIIFICYFSYLKVKTTNFPNEWKFNFIFNDFFTKKKTIKNMSNFCLSFYCWKIFI